MMNCDVYVCLCMADEHERDNTVPFLNLNT